MQVLAEDSYAGATIAINGKSIIYAWQVYTLSGLPGLESWVSGKTSAFGSLWLAPDMWFTRLWRGATFWDIIGATIVGVLFWLWLPEGRAKQPDVKARRLGPFVAIMLFAAYAPNAILVLTPKYQVWAHHHMWPYYYTSMSYLAWVVLGVGLAVVAYRRTNSIVSRRIMRGVFAGLAMSLVLAAASVTNETVSALQGKPFTHFIFR
jgi:hypothetical protein